MSGDSSNKNYFSSNTTNKFINVFSIPPANFLQKLEQGWIQKSLGDQNSQSANTIIMVLHVLPRPYNDLIWIISAKSTNGTAVWKSIKVDISQTTSTLTKKAVNTGITCHPPEPSLSIILFFNNLVITYLLTY